MTDVPCPKWLLAEINDLLNEDADYREVTVSQGILRKCCWHLGEYERLAKLECQAEEIEHLHVLLKVARCPNPDCDAGVIPYNSFMAVQCQWCAEKATAIKGVDDVD